MRLGIVADDLTGAMDSAAPFADGGLGTRVVLSPGRVAALPAALDPSVLAIDTHTRDVAGPAASEAVRASVAGLLGADRLPYKKIDSTLRGNIGAEIEAALASSGSRCAVITPAAPAQGRLLRDGYLFVHGERSGAMPLAGVLAAALPGRKVRSLVRGECDWAIEDGCIYIADAETEQDLDRIASLGLRRPHEILLAGSSGLAGALARQLCPQAPAAPRARKYQRLWFVVGSYNARSAEQVRSLIAERPVTTAVLARSGEVRIQRSADAASRVGLLHVEGLGSPLLLDGAAVANRLADVTRHLIGDVGVAGTALFLTGGDTARAILSGLGIDAIDVIRSESPGVVHGQADVAGQPLGVITKAGGFGSPDLFLQLVDNLL